MEIRNLEPGDLDTVAEVERIAWGEGAASRETIKTRAEVFPDGSIVAVDEGRIVGYAAAQLTAQISTKSWAEQTDNGEIRGSHVPEGRLAYGVSMSALPGISGEGVARYVIAHYTNIFLGTGRCSALCLGSRLPGFSRWSARQDNSGDLGEYVLPTPEGRVRDPELRLYAKNGFNVLWELPEYFPDPDSCDHGAMIVRTHI